jgi:hypothetical protein
VAPKAWSYNVVSVSYGAHHQEQKCILLLKRLVPIARVSCHISHPLHDLHAVRHAPKDRVLAIEPVLCVAEMDSGQAKTTQISDLQSHTNSE